MKNIIVDKTIRNMPTSVRPAFGYAEEAMGLEKIFRTKMQALLPGEFVDFLRPVFQEDELKLILIGAFLGMAAGFGQLFFVFVVCNLDHLRQLTSLSYKPYHQSLQQYPLQKLGTC